MTAETTTAQSRLEEIQRRFAAAVMRPLTSELTNTSSMPDGTAVRDLVDGVIAATPRLTSEERANIYNRQYWYRLIESMVDDFPAVCAVLGPARFVSMVMAYVSECPSHSFTLRDLGQDLLAFLQRHPEVTAPHTALTIDVARLEWAKIVAFDAPTGDPITPAHLAVADPLQVPMTLQPCVQLLALSYPADEFAVAVRDGMRTTDTGLSNARGDGELSSAQGVPTVPLPAPEHVWLAVHRFDYRLYYRRLTSDEYNVLGLLRQGTTLGDLSTDAWPVMAGNDDTKAAMFQEWFATWTQLGWVASVPGC